MIPNSGALSFVPSAESDTTRLKPVAKSFELDVRSAGFFSHCRVKAKQK
jgi:hypothetical protein